MWYVLDGDEIVFNTKAGRAKETNLVRDPRVSLLVYDDTGYRYVRIDGASHTVQGDQPGRLAAAIGSLSIAGIIPLSGFWSKDEVLGAAFSAGSVSPIFTLLWVMGILTAALTAFYMFRMMYLAFYGTPRSEHAVYDV